MPIIHAILLIPHEPAFLHRLLVLGFLVLLWLSFRNEKKIEEYFLARCDFEPRIKPVFTQYKYGACLPIHNFIGKKQDGNHQ